MKGYGLLAMGYRKKNLWLKIIIRGIRAIRGEKFNAAAQSTEG